jgi:hypothetical protein
MSHKMVTDRIYMQSLKNEIAEALNCSLKCNKRAEEHIIPKYAFIKETEADLSGESILFYELNIKASDLFFSEHYMLTVSTGKIKIYYYYKDYTVKLYKEISSHYILYILKDIKRDLKRLLFRILLNLVEQRVYRYEAWLEAVMFYLNVREVKCAQEMSNGVIVWYSNHMLSFNQNLEIVNSKELKDKKDNLNSATQQIVIKKNQIEIYKKNANFKDIRKIGTIKSFSICKNFIGILLDSKIVITVFEQQE